MTIEKVKQRIKARGLKKSFVANEIGLSAVMFSYYLNGKRNLSEEKEFNLKRYLKL